jgi:signal transduction histidine kinase
VELLTDLPTLNTNQTAIQQVFSNLISNAVKHHGWEEGHVWISCGDRGIFYEFSVADDGPGIAPQYHEKVFTIFQTLKSRDEMESTGIGLAVVKKIVEAEGGKITLESDSGQGATFRFTWPKGSN